MSQSHIVCFVAMPFRDECEVVLEAIRDVLEVKPYFLQVETAAFQYFARNVSDNVATWIQRASCYVADISDGNENVMMELGLGIPGSSTLNHSARRFQASSRGFGRLFTY